MFFFYIIGGGFGGKVLDMVEVSGVVVVVVWKYVYIIIMLYNIEFIYILWVFCSFCIINIKLFGLRE